MPTQTPTTRISKFLSLILRHAPARVGITLDDAGWTDVDALLVRPGSAKAIKDAILRLIAEPALGPRLASSARSSVVRERSWAHAQASLIDAYRDVLGMSA